ncbi:DUF456 domain-containing protein [Halosolutus amylolyticus]|uniref:DUF456 domain-containing protein n=1 Tax=Halosolutus amylolyticus TaxID=2932267 RepID=A0ABD5PU51_9EURY|nr:DUF456 domain-containing protein [Halosolutus amylolyticus]
MSDRSDEVTASREGDARSTDDLLEETEELLSGSGADAGPSSTPARDRSTGQDAPVDESTESGSWWRSSDAEPDAAAETDIDTSRLSRLAPSHSLGEYFSPKAFLALVLALGAGLFVGDTILPIGGRIAGMFAVAFAIGLVASKRRYLETTAAGVSVGALAALANHAVIAVAGSSRAIVAVGATVGLLSCVGGYYFGRDLRDGLRRDID